MYPLTCVSGYWRVKNKHSNSFDKWFKNTLKVNCPYVFFSDKETIELIKGYRGDLPTHYVEINIEDFYTYKYKDKMITHEKHCPSVELNLIWNEKIFLVEKALQLNPFDSEFFMWNDAGLSILRNKNPGKKSFPNIKKLNRLPKDKFIYTSSYPVYDEKLFVKSKYHLFHHITGTFILHKNIISKFLQLYKEHLSLIDKNDIYTDQVIWTLIYGNNKELFFKFYFGYGALYKYLR